MKKRYWTGTMLALLAISGCGGDAPQAPTESYEDTFLLDNDVWRTERREELTRPDGWTSLIGLHWLALKAHYVGSSAGSGIRLAMGPAKMGMVEQDGGRAWLTPESGVALTVNGGPLDGRIELKNDHDPAPTVIGFDEGKGALSLIERGGRLALRVKHADAPSRLQFTGLEYWPPQRAWRIEGRFIAHPPGKTIPIVDITGGTTESPNPGAVEFVKDGKTFRLEALGDTKDGLFFIFVDRTSGHGSYPAGRYLDTAGPDANGKVVLDFNRAYNPPCAFTTYATCPLPPPENRLENLAIEAGEKNYVPAAAQTATH